MRPRLAGVKSWGIAMSEMLKELGKLFYNLALLVAGAVIIQPLVKGHFSVKSFLLGSLAFVGLVFLGSVLIVAGEKLKDGED